MSESYIVGCSIRRMVDQHGLTESKVLLRQVTGEIDPTTAGETIRQNFPNTDYGEAGWELIGGIAVMDVKDIMFDDSILPLVPQAPANVNQGA